MSLNAELPDPNRPPSEQADNSSSSAQDGEGNHVIEIAGQGDVVLEIIHETSHQKSSYRFQVSSTVLKSTSRYFARLLQGTFGERYHVEDKHGVLRERYGALSKAPVAELPVVAIEDVGRISAVKSIAPLCTDFLSIIHGGDIARPPVANLANLAIVADRFDALEVIQAYVRRKKFTRAINGKPIPGSETVLTEAKTRQRILVGILLDDAAWMQRYSARLIQTGWAGKETDDHSALWWDLPLGIEEELACRRECILETIQSILFHFVTLYLSRERQCKLGYDSSTQCDSFQLGEMMRYFSRIEALGVQGRIVDVSEPSGLFAGDISSLLDTLRQVPEYQIDRNHSHCGIRTRLIPLIDHLNMQLDRVGICIDCWKHDRRQYAWCAGKHPLTWAKGMPSTSDDEHKAHHQYIRGLFTAIERDWSS